jgi:leucyl aminopeptidase
MKKITSLFLALLILLMLPRPTVGASSTAPTCGSGVVPASLITQISTGRWASWIRQLSGESTVQVGTQTVNLVTRYTPAMFWSGASLHSAAYDFLLQQVRQWYPNSQITQQDYPISYNGQPYTGKNLIVELTGTLKPDEIVILSAHFDTYLNTDRWGAAPGAEDNASGVATLLEAARLLHSYRFERTLQLIWFSGEEQGMIGSGYYTSHLPAGRTIIGDVNLDMFGYDADNDHCFELHVGTLPASNVIGQCFANTITANGLDLHYDYLTDLGEGYSDHESFWSAGLGAVEVLENYSNQNLAGGCSGKDSNPNYHTNQDKIAGMNLTSGANIARAGVATAANLASPVEMCFNGTTPPLTAKRSITTAQVNWSAISGATGYQLWRSGQGCDTGWQLAAETGPDTLSLLDSLPNPGGTYVYQVQATGINGCVSLPSTCTGATMQNPMYLPVVGR